MTSNKKTTTTKPIQPNYIDFYRAFEEQFRGSRELITSRLQVYLPFVEPLKTIETTPIALDLGCGRGEWLELLQNNGFQAKGVDLDEGMLSACYELNLDVQLGDALDYLRGLDADSLSVISAFHVVEHIPFEMLCELSTEAHRVLKPGGLLILETPNSENLMVGTSSFYLDPTHQRPLPAQLLSFVVEYSGFDRVKTLYLQDSPELTTAQQTSLVNVLGGASPDYAIVAQKNTSPAMAALFNAPFEQSYGLRLDALAARYDQETLSHTQWLQSEWDMAKQRFAGQSKYSLSRMVHLAMAGILSFSTKPLQAGIFVGVSFSVLSFVLILAAVIKYFVVQSIPNGWTTLVVLLLLFSGIQLIVLGIMGAYIGGIYEEVKGRPRYIIEEEISNHD